MSRTVEQITAEQRANVRHHRRWAHGVKAVASEIHGNAFDHETASVAAYNETLFQNNDIRLFLEGKLPGRANACGSGT